MRLNLLDRELIIYGLLFVFLKEGDSFFIRESVDLLEPDFYVSSIVLVLHNS